MILFLYGKDTIRSFEKFKEIKAEFLKKHGQESVKVLDFSEEPEEKVKEISNFLNAQSFFSNSQMVLCKNFFYNTKKITRKTEKRIEKILEEIEDNKNLWITFWEDFGSNDKKDFTKRVKILLSKCKTKIPEFTEKKEYDIVKLGEKELKKNGIECERGFLNQLYKKCHNDYGLFFNHLKSLIDYSLVSKKLELNDLKNIKNKFVEDNIFDILDAISSQKRSDIYFILKKHLVLYNSEPLSLLGLVSGQIRKLVLIKDLLDNSYNVSDVAKMLKQSPYYIGKLVNNLRTVSFKRLKEIYDGIQNIDYKAKTGLLEGEEIIDLLALCF